MTPEPRRVRAAVSYAPVDVRVETVEVPAPGRGEVLVALSQCGICGSDLLDWYVEQKVPAVLGHEPVGMVVEVGDDPPEGITVGSRVFAHHHVPCLDCDACRRGHETRCALFRETRLVPGGFAEIFLVPADNAARDLLVVPDHVTDDAATLIEPLACCLRGQRLAGVGADSRLLVVGAGQMGLLHVQAAMAARCHAVVAVDPLQDRRRLAEQLGAVAVEPDASAVTAAISDRPTVAIVCTYAEPAIRLALETVADGGTVQIFAPTPPGADLPLEGSEVFFREITVQGSYSAGPQDTRAALDLLADGQVTSEGIVTHRFPLAETARALEVARSTESVKVVVTADGAPT